MNYKTSLLLLIGILNCTPTAMSLAAEKVLYSFRAYYDGTPRTGPVVFDARGNLFGINRSTVFELSPPSASGGEWTETMIYSAGSTSYVPGAVVFRDGSLYGTMSHARNGLVSAGTVIRLDPPASGATAWSRRILYTFQDRPDGTDPSADPLVFAADGHIFGTTLFGGRYDNGAVFELSPPAPGSKTWTERIIYSFDAGGSGTLVPSGLVQDASGALYGTTEVGGANHIGLAYKLTPPAQGSTAWTYRELHSFAGSEGSYSQSGLVFDASGSLYGILSEGGPFNRGSVYELSPPATGETMWTLHVLYAFQGAPDGDGPVNRPVFEATGNLVGTTIVGGLVNKGTVYRLTPPTPEHATWGETILHNFVGKDRSDGEGPRAALKLTNGTFYGMTLRGGATGLDYGTVFSLRASRR